MLCLIVSNWSFSFFKFSKFYCFSNLCNTKLKSFDLYWFILTNVKGEGIFYTVHIFWTCSFHVMNLEKGFTSIRVVANAFTVHGFVGSIKGNSLPCWNWWTQILLSSVVYESILINLFNTGNGRQRCSIFPVELLQIPHGHSGESVWIGVVQIH